MATSSVNNASTAQGLSTALTPDMVLVAALLYMMSSDGSLSQEEISILQQSTGENDQVIQRARAYIKNNKVDTFIRQANEFLDKPSKLFVLLNVYDCMLSDGLVEKGETKLFAKLILGFGLTEKFFKPYTEIIEFKNNKSLLGEYKAHDLTIEKQTPHMVLGSLLIYMMSADGSVNSQEIGQISSIIGKYEGLQDYCAAQVRRIKFEDYITSVSSSLNDTQKLYIATNFCDSMMSDGSAADEELSLLNAVLNKFSLTEISFKPYFDLIKAKNTNPLHALKSADKAKGNLFKNQIIKGDEEGQSNVTTNAEGEKVIFNNTITDDQDGQMIKRTMDENIEKAKEALKNSENIATIQNNTILSSPTGPVFSNEMKSKDANFGNGKVDDPNTAKISSKSNEDNTQKIAGSDSKENLQNIASGRESENVQQVGASTEGANIQALESSKTAQNKQTIGSGEDSENLQQLVTSAEGINIQALESAKNAQNKQRVDAGGETENLQQLSTATGGGNIQALESSKTAQNNQRIDSGGDEANTQSINLDVATENLQNIERSNSAVSNLLIDPRNNSSTGITIATDDDLDNVKKLGPEQTIAENSQTLAGSPQTNVNPTISKENIADRSEKIATASLKDRNIALTSDGKDPTVVQIDFNQTVESTFDKKAQLIESINNITSAENVNRMFKINNDLDELHEKLKLLQQGSKEITIDDVVIAKKQAPKFKDKPRSNISALPPKVEEPNAIAIEVANPIIEQTTITQKALPNNKVSLEAVKESENTQRLEVDTNKPDNTIVVEASKPLQASENDHAAVLTVAKNSLALAKKQSNPPTKGASSTASASAITADTASTLAPTLAPTPAQALAAAPVPTSATAKTSFAGTASTLSNLVALSNASNPLASLSPVVARKSSIRHHVINTVRFVGVTTSLALVTGFTPVGCDLVQCSWKQLEAPLSIEFQEYIFKTQDVLLTFFG